MIKNKFKEVKLALVTWILSNWNSDSIFNKGKIIFIGFVLLMIIIKIFYAIFSQKLKNKNDYICNKLKIIRYADNRSFFRN